MEREYTSALKLYETASVEREAHMSLLRGREPPSIDSTTQPVVLLSTFNSLLLPTDPEAIDYPEDTGIGVCNRRILLSPLDVVLARMGSLALVDKLTELEQVVRSNLDQSFKKGVLANLTKESETSFKPDERTIDGRYWLPRLADAASSDCSLTLAVDYISTPAESLPAQKQHGYNKVRKYDAALHPSAAARSNIPNILVNVEFTKTEAPTAITNAVDLLTFQPTRLFVPTLSFHDKEEKTTLFTFIPSQERLEFVLVPNCFNSKGFPTVSALLHLFRIVSSYQPGYDPLFIYNFTLPPPNFSVGDAVPRFRRSSRHSGSIVLEGVLDEQALHNISTPIVVKLCFISERRQWRESIVVDDLYTADPEHPPAYAPKLLGALPMRKRKASVLDVPALVLHHLEVMLFASPRHGRKLKDLSAAEFFTAAEQPSSTPSAVASSIFLLVDWEFGGRFEELLSAIVRGTVTGTLDTMSVASLRNDDPLPHDDIESAVYVLLKVLTQTFVPPVDQQREWAAPLRRYKWDEPLNPSMLADLREGLWTGRHSTSTIPTTLQIFKILLSLEDLVKKAVDAARSVDASSWG
ncbi:hypothetical protein DFH08DRAFT_952464 [Mycena albidolilacea]|uniref:Uncharacterized protein n=1 Tax=Mycena albidolilacea TaxID=1033008 RepID=A0AAD7F0N4_9AGAR|nr:hypothetical protein DFH08DRAFT_952464 [Mycena albidolilacea]